MKTLIPMTSFILLQEEIKKKYRYKTKETSDRIYNYTHLLIAVPEIWMFLPCKFIGDNWVIMDPAKPPHTLSSENASTYLKKWRKEKEEYQKAKDRCLFEGFSLYDLRFSPGKMIKLKDTNLNIFWDNGNGEWQLQNNIITIEDLTGFNLEFTENAESIYYGQETKNIL
jgi:hypothetical protein